MATETSQKAHLEQETPPTEPDTLHARRSRWWRDTDKRLNVLVAGLLLLLAFAFMANGLPPNRVAVPVPLVLAYAPWNHAYAGPEPAGDILRQQLPWRHWTQQEWQAGRFPLWASAPLGGTSLFASMQPAVLFPLYLLWMLMPIGAGLGIIMALKLWLAGLGMWGFLRSLRLHSMSTFIGSAGFMFCAFMVAWLPWDHTNVFLLMPWLAWAVYEWWLRPRAWLIAATAVLVACGVFAGHPETLFMMLVVGGLWTGGLLLSSNVRQWLPRGVGLLLGIGLGFVIAAIQILPFLQALDISHIHASRIASTTYSSGIHLPLDRMVTWVLPQFWTYLPDFVLAPGHSWHEDTGYISLIGLLGVVLALVAGLRRGLPGRLVSPWVVILVFALIVTYDNTPLARAIRSLPGFNEAANGRWVGFVQFSALVLSAFGWDWFFRKALLPLPVIARRAWERVDVWRGVGWVLLVEGALIMLLHFLGFFPAATLTGDATAYRPPSPSYQFYWAIWQVGVLLVALGLVALCLTGGRAGRLAPYFLGALLIVDVWRLLIPTLETASANLYYPPDSFLQQAHDLVPPYERILTEGDVLPTDTALIYGVRDWRSQDTMQSERAFQGGAPAQPGDAHRIFAQYNMTFAHVHPQVGAMLGMRYLIFKTGIDPNTRLDPDPGRPQFTRLAYTHGLGLWRAEGVPGFSYLSDDVHTADNEASARDWLSNVNWAQVRSYVSMVETPPDKVAAVKHDPAGTSPGRHHRRRILPRSHQA